MNRIGKTSAGVWWSVVALRFFAEAHETFSLMAAHPDIGWPARLKHPELRSLRVFRVSGFERMLILYRPLGTGLPPNYLLMSASHSSERPSRNGAVMIWPVRERSKWMSMGRKGPTEAILFSARVLRSSVHKSCGCDRE